MIDSRNVVHSETFPGEYCWVLVSSRCEVQHTVEVVGDVGHGAKTNVYVSRALM
jgi:hypothetical protein